MGRVVGPFLTVTFAPQRLIKSDWMLQPDKSTRSGYLEKISKGTGPGGAKAAHDLGCANVLDPMMCMHEPHFP